MGVVRDPVNDQLLRLSYKDPKNIKNFLRNWGGLESLSRKGDAVATCILVDLKVVTGIDLEKFDRRNRKPFNLCYLDGKLSYYQYMSIAYTLVLGYSEEELAWVMSVSQQMINKSVNSGIRKIQKELKAHLEVD